MSVWLPLSRAILGVVGAIGLLLAGGNLLTGGASITDPVMPGGLVFGALLIGAAAWTSSPTRWHAVVVWLGVLAVLVAFAAFVANMGSAALRDVLVYFGIPAAIVLLAALGVAIGRVRAGALGG